MLISFTGEMNELLNGGSAMNELWSFWVNCCKKKMQEFLKKFEFSEKNLKFLNWFQTSE